MPARIEITGGWVEVRSPEECTSGDRKWIIRESGARAKAREGTDGADAILSVLDDEDAFIAYAITASDVLPIPVTTEALDALRIEDYRRIDEAVGRWANAIRGEDFDPDGVADPDSPTPASSASGPSTAAAGNSVKPKPSGSGSSSTGS